MQAAGRGEGGPALFQCRRGLAGTGLLLVHESLDQVLHCLAWHVGISLGMGCLSDHRPFIVGSEGRGDSWAVSRRVAALFADG